MRYKKARAWGKDRYEQAIREDQELLRSFGMELLSVENGLRLVTQEKAGGRINPWDVLHMNPKLWTWLRPLLVELAARRPEKPTASASSGRSARPTERRP